MNEWASKILSVFPADRAKADLDQFIMEVNNDQAEQMYYHVRLVREITFFWQISDDFPSFL